jgi:hypothetical protein
VNFAASWAGGIAAITAMTKTGLQSTGVGFAKYSTLSTFCFIGKLLLDF